MGNPKSTNPTLRLECPRKDLSGQIFGQLTVISPVRHGKRGYFHWNVVCSCGSPLIVCVSSLKHQQSCRPCRDKRHSTCDDSTGKSRVIRTYKKNAKDRNLLFQIETHEFIRLISLNCFYCNSPPISKVKSVRKYALDFVYNGLDRINSNLGYIPDNVVTCCFVCNRAKSALTLEQFRDWVIRIYKFRESSLW